MASKKDKQTKQDKHEQKQDKNAVKSSKEENNKAEKNNKTEEFISINEAMNQGSGKVAIRGWVYRERGSSKYKFIVMRDSTNTIQCVIDKNTVGDEKFAIADKVQIEAALEVYGEIKKDERAPTGYEIHVDNFKVIGECDTFPIAKDQSVEFLADNRHLWLRSRKMTTVLKVRSTVFGAIHEYFRANGFYEYQSPIFQSVQCEGGSTLFEVDYFKQKGVFLAQTWQLYAEPAIFALEKIYTIAPSFRAEKSKTSRHLTEYWHAEMEYAWSTFGGIIDHGENLIKHVIKRVLETNKPELQALGRDISKLEPSLNKPFARITYDEALRILKEKNKVEVEWGKDLRTIEEDELVKNFDTFVAVTHYPKIVKAFYMKEDPKNPKVVFGVDFLAPEGYGEIIGGSQREEKLEEIKKRLVEMGEKVENYTFYLDTRKYGSVPHGGFGMGVERLVSWICGLDNIKDAIPFPRTMIRWTP
jgi:asparaginyl-tRNA synthetase